jgi:hypothetical protein
MHCVCRTSLVTWGYAEIPKLPARLIANRLPGTPGWVPGSLNSWGSRECLVGPYPHRMRVQSRAAEKRIEALRLSLM